MGSLVYAPPAATALTTKLLVCPEKKRMTKEPHLEEISGTGDVDSRIQGYH